MSIKSKLRGSSHGNVGQKAAALIEQLRAELTEYKQRAEAAEAKLREMEMQEPVAWMHGGHLDKFIHKACGSDSMLARCSSRKLMSDYRPLYAKPFPAPKQEEK